MPDPRPPAFGSAHADSYGDGAFRQVPGLAALHRIASQLLAESVPPAGHVLVIGAGGGLELAALAADHPGWHFTGIDPSPPMLDRARARLADQAARVTLLPVLAEAAPPGPFDAALCLLTFHFIPRDQRRPTLAAIRARLRPQAPFVLAHMTFPPVEAATWFARNLRFAGTDPARIPQASALMAEKLTILDPAQEVADLAATGYTAVTPIWSGLGFRGWLAQA
jgi:tRNA (cmo5U34)-methyltransferase